jgi:hypothetical protein
MEEKPFLPATITFDLREHTKMQHDQKLVLEAVQRSERKSADLYWEESRKNFVLTYAIEQMIESAHKRGFRFIPTATSGANYITGHQLVAKDHRYRFYKIIKPRKKK